MYFINSKNNLLTNIDNEVQYFDKIADELIRYNRIRSFMFEPQTFISFSDTKYSLNNNEILIIQSLLNNDYFNNLSEAKDTLYLDNISYDNINPRKSISYAPVIDIVDNSEDSQDKSLIQEEPTKSSIKTIIKPKTIVLVPSVAKVKTTIKGPLPTKLILPNRIEKDITIISKPETSKPESETSKPETSKPESETSKPESETR